jgi:PAS domain S-box-containing protein
MLSTAPLTPNLYQIKAEAIENLTACLTINDPEGNFLYVNSYTLNMFGYTHAHELVNKSWKILYSGNNIDYGQNVVLPTLNATGNWVGDVKMTKKNGDIFEAHLNLTILPSGNICCLFQDVTLEREKDKLLNNLNLAVEHALDGIALLGPDEKYYYLNDKHVKYFGYQTEDELLGKTWRVIYDDDEIKRIEESLFPILMQTGKWQGETIGRRKDGSHISQEITLTTLPNGGMICIMRDITQRKLVENERAQLAMVARNTTNAVIITNGEHEIQWANQAAESILALDSTYFKGPIAGLLKKLGVPDKRWADTKNKIEAQQKVNIEFSAADNQGKTHWLYANISKITENNVIKNIVYVLVDITSIKEADRQLLATLEKEKSLNELKSRFVTLASHEFRTPLTSIQSSIELMDTYLGQSELTGKEKLYKHISRISQEVARMTELMNNVLVLGKINSTGFTFKPQQGDLMKFVQQLIVSQDYLRYNNKTEVKQTGNLRLVNFDTTLLTHMLGNLLSNALKYSPDTEKGPLMEIKYQETEIDFIVTDYGMGIPIQDQPKVFESFFRAGNTLNLPGTGLGLPIVKQFAELHQGKVELVSSRPGETIFKLTIKG